MYTNALHSGLSKTIQASVVQRVQIAIVLHYLQSHVRASEGIIRIIPERVNEGVKAPTVAKLAADSVMGETDVLSALFKLAFRPNIRDLLFGTMVI